MKKRMKRLALHRETLRNLSVLARVVGGDPNPTSYACFEGTGCDCDTQVPCTMASVAGDNTCATCFTDCECV